MSHIEWKHDGRRILLPIVVVAKPIGSSIESVPALALVDTGATASGIARPIIERLGLQSLGKRPLKSAHGEAQVARYTFAFGLFADSSPASAGLPFVTETLLGFEIRDDAGFGALLGMDVLRLCDFSMDRARQCRLTFA